MRGEEFFFLAKILVVLVPENLRFFEKIIVNTMEAASIICLALLSFLNHGKWRNLSRVSCIGPCKSAEQFLEKKGLA